MLKLFASYVDVYDLHHYGDVVDDGKLLAMYEQVRCKWRVVWDR
jgi:hypothetical protein